MRVIRGGPGSGKTALVFRELKQALRAGENAHLVVPTATLVRHFQHELARDSEVFAPSTVISLAKFAEHFAQPLKRVPDGVLRAIIRDALLNDRSPEFAAVAGTEGMITTLIETIALFENAGATPDRLASIRRLKGYGKAFARLWATAAERLRARGFATHPEILHAAAAQSRGLRLWFDGFLALSPLETELVRALGETCDVTITVGDTAHELWRQTLQWGCENRLLPGATRHPEIEAVNAVSMEREADEIALRITELRSRGVPYGEIAVGLRDAESYEPLLRGTFERFGVPARFYFASPLRRHPASMFLSGLMDCALNEWEFGATLDALRTNPGWGSSAAFDRFDFDVREAMPGRGVEPMQTLCHDEKLRSSLSKCFDIAGWIFDKRTPSQWCERLTAFAERVYLPGIVELPRSYADVETMRSQSAALNAWLKAVEESAGYWPDPGPGLSFADFWRIARDGIEASTVRIPDERRDVVHVMHVYEVRQWDVGTLFICGLTDREFPKKKQPNLLFSDLEIEAMTKAGLAVRKAADTDRDEDALFETLSGRARDGLVLSWPAHDAGGRRVESSRYVAQLMGDGLTHTHAARLSMPEPAITTQPSGITARIVSPDLLGPLAERHRTIAVTTLEDLAQCRFKFFAGRTLGLKTRPKRPQERLEARMAGLILHFALEEWLRAGRLGEFVPYFETAFNQTVQKEHLPEGYRLEVERIEARRIAENVSMTEKWVTAYPPEVEVEIKIPFPGGISVVGRIDRVDRLNETDCIVVDYKSGKTKNVEKFAVSPLKLQGPLYALALRETRGLNTVAMMFHAVREDKRFGWGQVPGVDLDLQPIPERWIEGAKERTIERLANFLAGEIRAEPSNRELCRWCDFANACRYEEHAALVMIEGATRD